MSYVKTIWVNDVTKLNATNMNKIEDELEALDTGKVDVVSGKGLSTNDYTTTDKNKLLGLDTTVNGGSPAITWYSGNITSGGVIVSDNKSNIYSSMLDLADITNMRIEALNQPNVFYANFAAYNADGTFAKRFSWIESFPYTFTDTQYSKYRIMLNSGSVISSYTIDEMLSFWRLTFPSFKGLTTKVSELQQELSKHAYLSNIIQSDFAGKILHFSFDDTCWCLNDLIKNSATYTSIWTDSEFFKMLKEVHDATGMCFTLNTFNTLSSTSPSLYPTTDNYDISNLPSKFASEFAAAKNWLKFAFHGENQDSNYNTTTGILASYNKFVAAIYQLTGDYDCIDSFTRLGYFGGNYENCIAIRDASHGIKGFLGADDTRAYDYYLTSDQYAILRKKGKYIDLDNKLMFIKTQYRTFSTAESDVEANVQFQKYTEFFGHEYEMFVSAGGIANYKQVLLGINTWAVSQGYSYAFPSVIFG